MANSRQAIKRVRQALKRREHNKSRSSMMRTLLKNVVKAIDAQNKTSAQEAFVKLEPILDRYAMKGLIHKNKAARHKSRLSAKIKALA